MAIQNTGQIKERITLFIERNGPSLPVHIAKEINTNMIFASAFLSELLSDKKIKISNMLVGNSRLHFLPGQEPQLEKFANHLKSKEREAFELLKQKQILKDSEQHPAIRVALKGIKDFAIPFEKNQELYWKYLTAKIPEKETEEIEKEFQKQENKEEKNLASGEKKEIEKEKEPRYPEESQNKKEKSRKKKKSKKKTSSKTNEKFFNLVKKTLAEEEIEIIGIEGFSKKDLTLKINEKGQEKLLIAHNKKRISEEDITKAYKKASELELEFVLMSKGELSKKTSTLINAIKNLSKIKKIK